MIKTERLNGPNPDVDFDETLEEFRFKKDAALTKTSHKELAVGNINSSTGQVDPNFDVANDGTTTLRGFEWSYDNNNEELVFSDPDGIELMRHPKSGSTQFLQGITRSSRNNVATSTSTTATDYFIGVDTSAGAFTVTLSTSDAEDGREIVVHDQAGNAGTNNITIDTEGTETISGPNSGTDQSSVAITQNNEAVTLRSDGADWYIV